MNKKVNKIVDRMKGGIAVASAWMTMAGTKLMTYADGVQFNTNYTMGNAEGDPLGLVVGISFYICRLIGVALMIWGIVGFILARKEGDAGSLTSEISKLAGGLILLFMPAIMTGLGVIQGG